MHTLSDIYTSIQSGRWPGSIARSSNGSRLYSQDFFRILEDSLRLARQTGINFGDKVVLVVESSPESIAAFVALWRIGSIAVPVKAGISAAALEQIATDCNARFCFSIADWRIEACSSYQPRLPLFRCKADSRVSGPDLALIIYTSGSTGTPKGIMLSHHNVVSALRSISQYLDLNSQDHILCVSPLSFDYGLYQFLFAFHTGCSLVLFDEPMHPVKLINALEAHAISVLPVVPVVATMLDKGLQVMKKTLPGLRKLTNTGGHLSEQTIAGLRSQMPDLKIYAMYGLTESKRALYLPPEDIDRKPGSVGIPMPGLEAKVFHRLTDSDGQTYYQEAQENEVGELFVRGASVMQGYCNPAANAGATLISGHYRDDNWLSTGDLFSCDEDGYFYFRGRAKELIKQGGYCLYPLEIEAMVQRHPQIALSSVVGTRDRMGNEIACLFVQLKQDDTDSPHTSVQQDVERWIKDRVAADYCPRIIKFVDSFALSINGKIDKKQMAESHL